LSLAIIGLSAPIASETGGLAQGVVDADVGPVQAGASKWAVLGQADTALGQVLELDLRPRLHDGA